MTANIITKVVELDNCNKDLLMKALYTEKFWEIVNPAKKIEAKFIAPNVLFSKITDEIINISIEMEGELVLQDEGEQKEGKGRLIELNVRNNKDVRELEGRIRIKALSPNKTKFGIYIKSFKLGSDFLSLMGNVAELTLRNKITKMLRKLEHWLKNNSLNDLL